MKRKFNNLILFLVCIIFSIDVSATEEAAIILDENTVQKEQIVSEWEEGGGCASIPEDFVVPSFNLLSDIQFTENYQDQLEGIEQNVYQTMQEFKEDLSLDITEMSTGDEFTFTTTYGALQDKTYVQEEEYDAVRMLLRGHVFRAVDAYLKDHPEVYWIKKISYQATIAYTKTEGMDESSLVEARISKIKIKRALYYDEILDEHEDVQTALAKAAAYCDTLQAETRYDRIKIIYDYVKELAEYNYDDLTTETNHTLTGILLDKYEHKCTCEGYAKLVKYLCDYYSIPNTIVIGGSSVDDDGNINVNHIWNVVKMEDGNWYLLDATWDDTSAVENYFLAGSNTIGTSGRTVAEEHLGSGYFSYTEYTPFTLPVLAEEAYKKESVPEEEEQIEVPEAVENLKACPAGKNKVRLFWDEAENAEGYLIYGMKNGNYGYVGMTDGTVFADKNALDRDYNYYWVFPYVTDANGKIHPGNCTKYVWAKGVSSAVTNLKAASVVGGVKMTWSPSADAEGYLVYGIVDGKQYGYVGMTAKETSYTDKKASKKIYNYYWVFPYYKDENGKIIAGEISKYVYGITR